MGRIFVFASSLFCWFLFLPAATAKETEYALAPVYFVTDRVPVKQNGQVRFIDYGQKIDSYSAGIRYVPVPLRDDIRKSWTELEAQGWIDKSHYPAATAKSKKNNPKAEALAGECPKLS